MRKSKLPSISSHLCLFTNLNESQQKKYSFQDLFAQTKQSLKNFSKPKRNRNKHLLSSSHFKSFSLTPLKTEYLNYQTTKHSTENYYEDNTNIPSSKKIDLKSLYSNIKRKNTNYKIFPQQHKQSNQFKFIQKEGLPFLEEQILHFRKTCLVLRKRVFEIKKEDNDEFNVKGNDYFQLQKQRKNIINARKAVSKTYSDVSTVQNRLVKMYDKLKIKMNKDFGVYTEGDIQGIVDEYYNEKLSKK